MLRTTLFALALLAVTVALPLPTEEEVRQQFSTTSQENAQSIAACRGEQHPPGTVHTARTSVRLVDRRRSRSNQQRFQRVHSSEPGQSSIDGT